MSATDMPMNLEEVLYGIQFPSVKAEIINYAEENGASEEAMEVLRAFPERDYRNMQDINEGLGLIEEQPGSENIWSSHSKAQG
jgi:hypothetical protein